MPRPIPDKSDDKVEEQLILLFKTALQAIPLTRADESIQMLATRAMSNLNWEWYVPFLNPEGLNLEMQLRGISPMTGYIKMVSAVVLFSSIDYLLRTASGQRLDQEELETLTQQRQKLQTDEDYAATTVEALVHNTLLRVCRGYQEWFNFPVGAFISFPPGGDVTFGNFKSTSFWHKMIYLNELVIEVYGMTGAFMGDTNLHHRTLVPCVMTDPPNIDKFPAVSEHMKIWERDPFE